jgi:large subunit ribosomal protein L2
MALKSYKPTTPGQRGLVLIDRSELWKGRPVKTLTEGLTKKGGRNNTGRITMRRKGGGAKRLYRIVDFRRNKMDVSATVERIEYDPNRTAFIALVKYDDGEQAYVLAPQRLAIGDKIISAAKADIKPGNAMPFSGMPIGTIIHNIEMKPGKGGQIARAAGTYAQFVGRDGGYAQIRLSSGELRLVRQECMATVGAVSNPDNSNQNFGKADIKPGNAMPFSGMPIGTIIHNIEMKPGKGGQIARAAGTYAQFVGRDGGYAQIRLSSGELRLVRQECMATVGAVSNPDNSNQNFGKAGRMRHKGIRPSVRGVVMNPVDHPHGGGEGRTSGGRHPVSPWGKPTKGARTRNKNKASQKLIIRSRHAKKKGR